MTPRRLKFGYYVLEGINSFATGYFINYLFFILHERHGFTSAGNLGVSALNGFVYMFGSLLAGRFAQRFGYYTALRIGFSGMALALLVGSQIPTVGGCLGTVIFWTLGMCFTWPALEALVSEGENTHGLQNMVGMYNIVWAGTAALAYFAGGVLIGLLGEKSLYWLPILMHISQLFLLEWLASWSARIRLLHAPREAVLQGAAPADPQVEVPQSAVFLKMAWIANPFAYMAINTLLPLIPDLAKRMNLSMAMAGVFCSLWFFARMASFVLFWRWPGWHYKFRWLVAAYVMMLLSFLIILLGPWLWLVIAAQIIFGFSIGLMYYSSLYYSMHVGETKGEHGGFHEAAIGLGVFVGPTVGASFLHLVPDQPYVGPWAVGALLLMGGIFMTGVRWWHIRRI